MQRFRSVSIALLIGLAKWATSETLPKCQQLNLFLESHEKHLIRLQPRYLIPDQASSPLQLVLSTGSLIGSNVSIEDVRVHLQDLSHPAVADLEMLLGHAGRQEVLFNGHFVSRPFQAGEAGTMDFNNFADFAEAKTQNRMYRAVSLEMAELESRNLAQGCSATQKSTGFDGTAGRAVDGELNPFYSSGSVTHTGGDNQVSASMMDPWWQVHLNASANVSFIRVFNRQVGNTKSEVQEIETVFWGPLDKYRHSSFQLSVRVGEQSAITGPILPSAVATKADEVGTPGTGAGLGESIQSILEATTITQGLLVSASKSKVFGGVDYGAMKWRVTFSGLLGDVPQMTVAQTDFKCLSKCFVQVHTVVNGGYSEHYLQQQPHAKSKIEGRLYPFTVSILSFSAAASLSHNATLHDVLDAATWSYTVEQPTPNHTSLSSDKWKQHVLIPVPQIEGQVVRVQLQGSKYLSLAEVQVYGEAEDVLTFSQQYDRLVPGSSYKAYGPIRQSFAGTVPEDAWTLTVRDFKPRQDSVEPIPRPLSVQQGKGSLGFWAAHIKTSDGNHHSILPKFHLRIATLPQYGKLFAANISFMDLPDASHINASSRVQGEEIRPAPGMQQFREPCTSHSFCKLNGELIGPRRSTSASGGIVSAKQRLTLQDNAFSVVYEPLSTEFVGKDWFTYTAVLGDKESEPALVEINVHPCEGEKCDVEYRFLSPAEKETWLDLHVVDHDVHSARVQWSILEDA